MGGSVSLDMRSKLLIWEEKGAKEKIREQLYVLLQRGAGFAHSKTHTQTEGFCELYADGWGDTGSLL